MHIVDSYRLSPMQEGMLFHHLRAPDSGIDVEQLVCSLHEPVDAGALAYAWERIIERHAVMRTSFQWENCPQPVQHVHDAVELPFQVLDWGNLGSVRQKHDLNSYLAEDRLAEFAWDHPPLMRIALFRFSDDDYTLVWSFHHAVLDGRSFHVVLDEVFRTYDARCKCEEVLLPPTPPYLDYIRWLDTLDFTKAENYWRGALKGFSVATALPSFEGGGQSGSGASHRLEQWRDATFCSGIRMWPFSSTWATSSR